jgi:stringent starvation protein B
MKISSRVPYLLQPLLEWLLDNDMTPYLIVNTLIPEVSFPAGFAQPDGRIIFNVSPSAVRNFTIEKDYVLFDGRFSGCPFEVYVPVGAVLALVSKETGDGMWFPENDYSPDGQKQSETSDTQPERKPENKKDGVAQKGKKPSFTIVK